MSHFDFMTSLCPSFTWQYILKFPKLHNPFKNNLWRVKRYESDTTSLTLIISKCKGDHKNQRKTYWKSI